MKIKVLNESKVAAKKIAESFREDDINASKNLILPEGKLELAILTPSHCFYFDEGGNFVQAFASEKSITFVYDDAEGKIYENASQCILDILEGREKLLYYYDNMSVEDMKHDFSCLGLAYGNPLTNKNPFDNSWLKESIDDDEYEDEDEDEPKIDSFEALWYDSPSLDRYFRKEFKNKSDLLKFYNKHKNDTDKFGWWCTSRDEDGYVIDDIIY